MKVRLRKDLNITQRLSGLDHVWILKDPVAFTHFQFSEHEYFLAQLFDGRRSLDEVVADWRKKFQSSSLSAAQVQKFVQRLMGDNLLLVDQPGYGAMLCASQRRRNSGNWWMNPLAIRFRGANPTVLLRELDWVGAILFHPAVIVTLMLFSSMTLLFLLGNFESVAVRIPGIEHLLSTQGLLGLLISVAIIKVLHELGHAMACRRYGAECLEIGVMLLALIPTLYCNVSDAWSIKQRWKRMVVSFAGMYVEICLASVAAILWMMTPPGLLNALLFNVVMLCSLNTLLVNGNPLLRYDGYYLLSDWLEKPNLSEQANNELNKLTSAFTRSPNSDDRSSTPLNVWLLVYSILAFVYRWFVVSVILFALVSFAALWQAQTVGLIVAGMLLLTMMMGRSKAKRMASRTQTGQFSWMRTSLTIGIGIGLLWFVMFVPIPKSVYSEFEVGLDDAIPVFSPSDGRLISIAEPFQVVEKGETVAMLENPELTHSFEMKRLELDRARNELRLLESRINEAPEIASEVEVAQKNVAAVQAAYLVHESELARLKVVAPSGGVVFPASERAASPARFDPVFIPGGRVSDERNGACLVRSSEHLLSVAEPKHREVVMFVNENDMDFIEAGQDVRLVFYRIPGLVARGEILRIFEDELNADEASDASRNPVERNSELERKTFRVIVEVDQLPVEAVSGAIGRAKISVANQSVATRLKRVIDRAMNTRL